MLGLSKRGVLELEYFVSEHDTLLAFNNNNNNNNNSNNNKNNNNKM